MDKLLSANTIKNVFYALGAKTSDSNYAVALLNKTSGAPAGFMDMSNLASVLGGIPNVADSTITDFNSVNYSCITTINGTNVQNSPKNGWGCFVCIKSGAYCPQMFFVGSDRSMYYRTSNNGDWIRSYDNTILSDSTILSPLASALGAASTMWWSVGNNGGQIAAGETRELSLPNQMCMVMFVCTTYGANQSGILYQMASNIGKGSLYLGSEASLTDPAAKIYVQFNSSSSKVSFKNNNSSAANMLFRIF